MAHFVQEGILLEPGPEHGEVVDLVKAADVEALPPFLQGQVFEVIDDLALAGSGPGDEEEDVENVFLAHWGPLMKQEEGWGEGEVFHGSSRENYTVENNKGIILMRAFRPFGFGCTIRCRQGR